MIRRRDYRIEFNRHVIQWRARSAIATTPDKRYEKHSAGTLRLMARRANQSGKTDELSRILRELRKRMTAQQMAIFSIQLETYITTES